MARVFIIEPPSVNVEKAERFGEIIILINDQPRVSALDSDYYAGLVIEALEGHDYSPKEDYLCLVGSMSSIAVSVAAMITRWKHIKCLVFNGSRSDYVLRTLGKWRYQDKWKNEEENDRPQHPEND